MANSYAEPMTQQTPIILTTTGATKTVTRTPVAWNLPDAYRDALAEKLQAARVQEALSKYRQILRGLPAQQHVGDPSVLLVELADAEDSIIEAEALVR